jgi:ATP-dependent Clp protease ATP-binding subunit ClpX
MLDIMYRIPSHKNIKECIITDKVIENNELPILIKEKTKKEVKETA